MRTPSRASLLSSHFSGPRANGRGGSSEYTSPSEQRQDPATSPAALLRGLIAAAPRVDPEAARRQARADYEAKTESRRADLRQQLDQLRAQRVGEGGAS